MIDDFGVISAKRTFKVYSEEHKMINFKAYTSLSEGKTVSSSFRLIGQKHSNKKIPHRKQDCSDCDNGKVCSDCVIKPKMNCFNCEMERACETWLDIKSQKKTYFTDINMLKR